ncbi:arginine--tRNA ligase [Paenibacillus tritici]|uniref:arginine--tRNA ligase n=1 Tax=Paenibacillus tritici TaxID=1873425 RepID=UPI001BAC8D0A|nr:arginine--tRNA ligase [Paenibacillus tritici]QUL58418.1 arginine--tRNA ligase [Paenibacillus tritici]
MLSELIQESLKQCIHQISVSLGTPAVSQVTVELEQPANAEHGDYSSNIAMQLARTLRKAPNAIAEMIVSELQASGSVNGLLMRIEVAAPGFINMYMDWQAWAQTRDTFALPRNTGGKVIVEHTSVNPNKSMHIGHLRNSCIGDALVRMLRHTGYSVEVHNYVDDLGNQLADTVVGLLNIPLAGEHVRFGDYCWDIYAEINKAYAQKPETVQKRTEILHALEEGHGNTAWIGNLVAGQIVKEHVEEMRNFGIEYDLLVWESHILKEGFWSSAFDLLSQTEVFVQEHEGKLAGCWILKQPAGDHAMPDTGEEHQKDKVLVRSNGILTYTAKDIAYHLWKFGLLGKDLSYSEFNSGLWTTGMTGQTLPFGQADKVVNVIDYRQEYPQAMVKQALKALGFTRQADSLHHVSYGVVSLSPASAAGLGIDTSGGKSSYAMSGRHGIGIKVTELVRLMEDMIESTRADKNGLSSRLIATAAIRYYLLRFNLGTEIVFDFKQAMEISGNTGVYLMYAYARAQRVLSKGGAAAEGNSTGAVSGSGTGAVSGSGTGAVSGSGGDAVSEKIKLPLFPPQLEAAELALLRQLSLWQDTLYTASQELTPNTICNYAHGLASLFNHFYSSCPILKGGEASIAFRLWLTRCFTGTLGEALDVLGLPKPDRM